MRIAIVLCTLLGFVVMADANFPSCKLPRSSTGLRGYYKSGEPIPPRQTTVKATFLGTPVTFRCPKGYTLVGKPAYTCYDYGWFPWVFPRCIKREYCGRRRAPENGYISPNPNIPKRPYYKIGTVIQFSCRDGYRLEGKDQDRCGNDGEWVINTTPKCVLIKCPYRAPPANGFVNPKKKFYYFKDIITFSCKKPRYVLIGKPKDKCGEDDEWILNKTPRCQIRCLGRDAPDNGSVDPELDFIFPGKGVNFKCNKGYRLQGNPSDLCKPDGEWKINKTPKCVLITCPQRMAPANGAIQGVVDPYLPTNEIKFVCDEGYRLVGEEIDTCQRNGVWDVNKTPSCKIIPCRQRRAPANGKIVGAKNPYLPEDMISFECDEGYRLIGEDEDTCLLGGSWDVDKTPTCQLIICPQRQAPANGGIQGVKNPYVPDDEIKFVCDEYYRLEGEEMDKCQDDGSWEIDDTPKCVQITCPQRMAPENGKIEGVKDPYVPENTIKFVCDKYYRLEGEEDDTCQGDGSWDVNETPRCVQITCSQRKAPVNGTLLGGKDPYTPTDMIRFKCDDEFRLVGEDKDRCEEDGSWRIDRTPRCVLILCKKYAPPKNGAYILYPPADKVKLQPGTKLRFYCLPGFQIVGYPFDKCEEGGVWKYKKLPKCVLIPTKDYYCGYRNAPLYGYIKGKKDKYAVGDKIQFSCKPGYETEIKYDLCLAKGLWKYEEYGKYPECRKVPGY